MKHIVTSAANIDWLLLGVTGFYAAGCGVQAINQTGIGRVVACAHGGSNPAAAKNFALRHGIRTVYDSGEEAIRDSVGKVQGVAIFTPNHTHEPLTRIAVDCGFDLLLVEKPAARNLAETQLMAKHIRKKKKIVFGQPHQYPWFPAAHAVIEGVQSGKYGRILEIEVVYDQG